MEQALRDAGERASSRVVTPVLEAPRVREL
jgi:hypothetical protein